MKKEITVYKAGTILFFTALVFSFAHSTGLAAFLSIFHGLSIWFLWKPPAPGFPAKYQLIATSGFLAASYLVLLTTDFWPPPIASGFSLAGFAFCASKVMWLFERFSRETSAEQAQALNP